MKELDSTDAKILFELDRNCRQSQKQIAKRVGATRNIVIHRIKKLEEAGIVRLLHSDRLFQNRLLNGKGLPETTEHN